MKKIYLIASWIVSLILAIGIGFLLGLSTPHESKTLGIKANPYIIVTNSAGVATTTEYFGDVNPQVDNLYALGSASKKWIGNFSTINVDNCVGCSGTETDTLLSVTNRGGYATSSVYFYGGATSSNLTATGTTSLQGTTFTSATGTDLFVTNGLHVSSTGGIPFGPPVYGYTAGAVFGISDWYTQSNLVFINSGIKGSYGFTNYVAECGDAGSGTEAYYFSQASSSDIGFATHSGECINAISSSADPAVSRFAKGLDTRGYFTIASTFGPPNYAYSNTYDLGGNGVAMRNIYASGTGFIANVTSTNVNTNTMNFGKATGTLIHSTGGEFDYVVFASTTCPTYTKGMLCWDDLEKTVGVYTGLDNVVMQVGQEMLIRVRNNTGSDIPNGSVVYHTGSLGNRPTVALAQANSTTTAKILGMTTQEIAVNADGFVTLQGNVNDLDTSAFAEGDNLYLSATVAGAYVSSTPVAPNLAIRLGSVMTSNPAVGRIYLNYDKYNTYTRSFGEMRVHDNILPASDSASDIGSTALRFGNGYFDTLYGTVTTSQVLLSKLSATTTNETLYDYLNYLGSSGSLTTSTISDLGTGSIQVGTRDIWIKTANTSESEGKFYTFATDTVALTDNQLNYLYIDYNGGVPDLKATTDRTTIHDYDQFTIGRGYRQGTNIDIVQSGTNLYNEYRRIHNRLVKKYGFDYASGAIISETPTLKLGVTAGVYYIGNTEINTDASSTAFIKSYYRDGGTGWTQTTASSTFADPLYDDNSGTLATVLPNQYAVFWLYECPQGELYRVYGQASYTLAGAQASTPPSSLPDYITKNTRLRAKAIYLRGATSFAEIDNVSSQALPVSGVSSHSALGNLNWASAGHTFDTNLNIGDYFFVSGNGSATTTFASSTFIFNSSTGYAGGKINFTSTGNINASGTILTAGLSLTTSFNLSNGGLFTINNGYASATLEIMGGSLWTLAQYSGSSATNVPTSTAYYLGTNGTMIPGMLFDATNTQYGFTDQIHLGDGCATTTMPVTFYWTTATGTGSVVWGIRAKAVAEGEYDDSAWGSWVYATGTFSNSYYRMSTSTLTNLTPASWDSCRDTLYFQVVRNQESGDTFGGGALLEKVVLEYGKKSLTD